MDYAYTVTFERIKRVQALLGVNSPVVYCELAKLNQKYVDEIQAAVTDSDIIDIWQRALKTGFISYKIRPIDINMEDVTFTELSFNDKKRFLMEILDKNLLYVNYCDIDDEEFSISDEDKTFTKSFYKEG